MEMLQNKLRFYHSEIIESKLLRECCSHMKKHLELLVKDKNIFMKIFNDILKINCLKFIKIHLDNVSTNDDKLSYRYIKNLLRSRKNIRNLIFIMKIDNKKFYYKNGERINKNKCICDKNKIKEITDLFLKT